MQTLNYQLMSVNKKVEDMKSTTVAPMQRKQAVSSEQLDQMQQGILALQSRIEEIDYQNQILADENKNLRNALTSAMEQQKAETSKRFTELTDQSAQQKNIIIAQQEQIQLIQTARLQDAKQRAQAANQRARAARENQQVAKRSNNIIQLKAQARKKMVRQQAQTVTAVKAVPTSKPVSVTAEPVKTTPQQTEPVVIDVEQSLFEQGQAAYQSGRYQAAHGLFAKALKETRQSSEQATARYMMGESLFKQKQYDQSILEYQEVISKHAKHEKAPTALLRQAQAFQALSDEETAKIIHRKILQNYPQSAEALELKSNKSKP
ncbi:MAG: tetratricopeptide repeat protein [Desulfobulbaceae bacterium]|uniref:Tetratricopeptide repeat protein n=1 Tax=Candidatus Desulfatifera sulfidica TaxID=2841691 RepID=A0A8J6NA60_9BACT|nr:tetratricopeptide repeat protein [Candidatus Desulfatifera sulfidica]